jgi:hypothetical protein
MAGGTQYSVEYENHFYHIFLAYLLEECHKYCSDNYIIFHQLDETECRAFVFPAALTPGSPI